VKSKNAWSSKVSEIMVKDLNDEDKANLFEELNNAVMEVCLAYGIGDN
jgi:hypothetical protein